ncbi:MAG: hypothetical protein ACI4ET_06105 [Bilifractor sp.]
MNFLHKMEQKIGKYAIHHLTVYIIMTYVAGYILYFMASMNPEYQSVFYYLTLSPSLILKGQVWRLISWWLIPPSSLNIWTIVMLICYFQLGTLLERTWGDFLYNVYIFFGLIMTVAGAFLLYAFTGVDYGQLFSTYYVSLSIFLGFAMTFPDQQMLFMFIIPIRIKYLAILDIVYLVYDVVSASAVMRIPRIIMIVCSLAGTIIFFFLTRGMRGMHGMNKSQRQTRKNFRRYMNGYNGGQQSSNRNNGQTGQKIDRTTFGAGGTVDGKRRPLHRCAICGRTELDDPDLEFRFCSKCNGNYEYCQDHLYNHKHVQ